jgi:hypothetical protein
MSRSGPSTRGVANASPAAPQDARPLVCGLAAEPVDESGLADTRLTGDDGDPAVPSLGCPEQRAEHLDLGSTLQQVHGWSLGGHRLGADATVWRRW